MPFSDNRARLLTKPGYTEPYGGGGSGRSRPDGFVNTGSPGEPLRRTSGIVFPYTPNISVSHQVEYSTYEVVHTNFQQLAYNKTRNPQIQVTANFINQTPDETAYSIGVIHFLRVVTKMNWGANDRDRGTPPPVLEFSAYGLTNFDNVPVVVQSFNMIYDDNVDYVEGPDGQNLPVFMTIAIDLLPTYSPAKQNQFNLHSFANGSLYSRGFI